MTHKVNKRTMTENIRTAMIRHLHQIEEVMETTRSIRDLNTLRYSRFNIIKACRKYNLHTHCIEFLQECNTLFTKFEDTLNKESIKSLSN